MRNIKFRVWIKPEHWYIENNEGLMTAGLPLGGWDKWWLNLSPQLKNQQGLDGEFTLDMIEVMQFTGFQDSKGNEIYDGDILSDWTETDEDLVQSFCQVFWCEKTGMWRLDFSTKQDKTYTESLYTELRDFRYEITGNIFENKELLK